MKKKTTIEFLSFLRRLGIQISVDGNKLHCNAPTGILTPTLRQQIKERKTEILIFLNSVSTIPSISPTPRQRYQPFPLTEIQQAYWVGRRETFELGNMASQAYWEFESYGFELERLNLTWQKLIERHDMLRTVVLSDGQQQILKQVPPYQISVLDLRGKDTETITMELETIRQQMSFQELLTDKWPLFEVKATCFDNQRFRLHIKFDLLIVDGWSLQILMREFSTLYENPNATLTPLELSFRDYVLAKVALQKTTRFKRDQDYWYNRIPTLPPAPELPLAQKSQSLTQHQFARLTTKLKPEVWLRFKKRTMQADLTPSMALCAAYTEVVSAWSKTSRFTITVLYFNRLPLHPEVNHIVGNFSSTILLEADNLSEQSFETRAKHLQKQLRSDIQHNLISGVQVLREINRLQSNISNATIPITFASILDNQNSRRRENIAELTQINQVYGSLQVPQVLLDHQVYEDTNGALVLNWDFVDELFPEELVKDMFDAYVRFLHRLTNSEEVWLEISPNLLPSAQLDLYASTNATQMPFEEKLLHIPFIAQASERPQQLAIASPARTLTYEELYRRSHQLGNQLRQLGARPNMLVGVVMEKGWEQVVAVLAILMAGAAYVPIASVLPRERRWQLYEQSDIQIVLTQSWLNETLQWPKNIQRICVDTAGQAPSNIQPLEPIQQLEDLAYIIYTSGSTGVPKGVMIDHRGANNTIVDINRRFSVGADDKVLALSSLSFDLSVYDIFGTLAAGGTIVFPDASATRDPAHWLELMTQQQVTVWNSVPALMRMLVEYATGSHQVLPSSLRLVMLSGDWIPLTLPPQIKSLVKDVQVMSLGGATEASIWSIFYPIETYDPTWKSIPYGRPMANQKFYVLNEALEPCPIWVPGQLYIGGIGLAKGYWRNEEKTRASFITHPRTGERLYRTGDLGRYFPDGNIEFLGREDFQVKVQGYRIECGEIETTLLQHPAVQTVVVTAIGERQGDKRLVAYVVPVDQAPTPAELRDCLAQKLPEYMVPASFILLDALPLTSNGKVDRRALPAPDTSSLSLETSFVPPRNKLELQLAQIWQNILSRSVGVRDNFFELGGHSLLAVRLMTQIEQRFGKNLPLATLFQSPTIEQLANLLRQQTALGPWSPLVAIQPAGHRPPFFCIHPSGGNVLCYVELARHLGPEQPFYGLQSPGLNGEQKPLTRIEEMATHYIEALQTIQPQGPYYLGGWSLGGFVAFEMAQQLLKLGHEIALLALIDSAKTNRTQEIDNTMLVASLAKDLGGSFGKPLSISADELQRLGPEEQLNLLLERAKIEGILPPEVQPPQMHQMLSVFKTNLQAMYRYVPQYYPDQITLFCACEPVAEKTQDSTQGWGELAGRGVEINQIPGDHYTMVREPHVQILAERLRTCLLNKREKS